MWRILSFPCMTIEGKSKISLHVEKFQMSSHDRCGKIWNSPHLACVWCRKRHHIYKIYAIFLKKNQFCQKRTLSRNPFCRNLRTFVWRKIYRKNDKYEVCKIYIYIIYNTYNIYNIYNICKANCFLRIKVLFVKGANGKRQAHCALSLAGVEKASLQRFKRLNV